jgi:hypothetical protein
MNRSGNTPRLVLCLVWILLGFFTIKAIIKNMTEIQKNLDTPNPIIKKFGLENNM